MFRLRNRRTETGAERNNQKQAVLEQPQSIFNNLMCSDHLSIISHVPRGDAYGSNKDNPFGNLKELGTCMPAPASATS